MLIKSVVGVLAEGNIQVPVVAFDGPMPPNGSGYFFGVNYQAADKKSVLDCRLAVFCYSVSWQ